jgi:DNA-binding CsgD family transcriptional regulator
MGQWPQPPLPRRWSGVRLPPFVGRERQFAVLEDVWGAVTRGARQVVFVAGEAGSGKSRLCSESAAMLHRHGVPVLVGTCVAEFGRDYDPFVEPLTDLIPALDSGALTPSAGGPDAEARARRLRLITGTTASPGLAAAVHQPELFSAVTEALAAAAAVRPLMLVLEDVHWAGEGALTLLRFAVERTSNMPILFLVTIRTEPPDLSPQVSGVVTDLMRLDGASRLDLPGLVTDEIAEYLVRGFGLSAATARPAASILRDHTAGNPYLLREVCRERGADLASGALLRGAPRAPESVRQSTRARVERLTPGQRTFLETAAVIGEEFDVPLVTASWRPLGDTAVEDPSPGLVFEALESARAAGLIEWVPERSGVGRFPHALARQSVLELMTEFDRAAANARVAVALEQRFPAADRRLQRLAHHFSNAVALGFADQATDYLERAADADRARLSYTDAAQLYERAASHAATATRRDGLLLACGKAHLQATHLERARQLAEQVTASGTPEQALQAAMLFESAAWQANAHQPRSVELLTAALARTEAAGTVKDRIIATAALARAVSFSERPARAVTHRADAIRQAREVGDPALLAAVLSISLLDGAGGDQLADRLRLADELTGLVDDLGDVHYLGPAAFHRCVGHYVLGNPTAVDLAYLDLVRMTQATNEPYWTLALSIASFSLHLMRCDFAEAALTLERTARLSASVDGGYEAAEGPWSLQSYILRRETGDLEAARQLITGEEDPAHAWAPGLLALYTEFSMAGAAARVLHWILAGDLEARQRSASWPLVLSFLVDAATWLQDGAAARALLPLAGRFADRNLVASEFVVALGSGDRLIGALESVLGEPTAEAHFVAALDMDTRMGSPLHRATTLAEHVAHLRRSGGSAGLIRSLTSEALSLCDRHSLERVRRLLGPDAVNPVKHDQRDALTPRETEVLRLLGRGCSNREIATTLVISEYTAANHVRNILGKIQCANRTQAAMYAVAHGLAGTNQRPEVPCPPATRGVQPP